MQIGDARLSTDEQSLDPQRAALEPAWCEVDYEDWGGPGLLWPVRASLMRSRASGREMWKLDRLGRSVAQLIQLIDGIGRAGSGFVSLSESIDTTAAGGRLIFPVMGALAEFERSLIGERTAAGMKKPPSAGGSMSGGLRR